MKDHNFIGVMENISIDDAKKVEKKKNGIHHMPKAVPAILLNILLERFSTTGTSGEYTVKCIIDV